MSGEKPYYFNLVEHYEDCFIQHGATPKGVDWPNTQDLMTRFEIMLKGLQPLLSRKKSIKLLDVGCGYGALFAYLNEKGLTERIQYHGIDLSTKMITHAKLAFSDDAFSVRNILLEPFETNTFDYAILNGVFTEKRQLTQVQMEQFITEMLTTVYQMCQFGFAFNVMNYHVDWYRDELFYLPFDRAAAIVKANCSRHYRFNADYGLYEYTTYVYREAVTL